MMNFNKFYLIDSFIFYFQCNKKDAVSMVRNICVCIIVCVFISACVPTVRSYNPGEPSGVAHSYYRKGLELGRNGNFSGALSSFQQAIQIQPDYQKAYFMAGMALMQMKSFKTATEYARKAYNLKPDDLDAMALLSSTLFISSQFHECIGVTLMLIKHEPRQGIDMYYKDKLLAFDALALSSAYLGNYTEAIQYFKDEIATPSSDPSAVSLKHGAQNMIKLIQKEINRIQTAGIKDHRNSMATNNNSHLDRHKNSTPSTNLGVHNDLEEPQADFAKSNSPYRKAIEEAVKKRIVP